MNLYYPVTYQPPPAESACTSLIRLATVGAVVGGAAAAGSNFRRLENEEIEPGEALANTGRTALAGAVAATVAGAAASVVQEQGLLRLGVMFAAGAAAMYGLESSWAKQREKSDE